MNTTTHENNIKFLSEKQIQIAALLRDVCRDSLCMFPTDDFGNIDIGDLFSVYADIFGKDMSPCIELAIFCSECSRKYSISYLEILDNESHEDIANDHPQIAYLKNSFADKAYRKTAQLFDKVSAVYLPGFREVCEEVYYGRSTYALLPVFSSSDGQLSSFRQLISKYDLNIIYAVDVKMSDEGFMRYALLRKGLNDSICSEKINYLDISIVSETNFKLGDFLAACEFLGASVTCVNSYPSEYSEDSSLVYITFDVAISEIDALCLFLEASHVRYNTIGAYNIKQ